MLMPVLVTKKHRSPQQRSNHLADGDSSSRNIQRCMQPLKMHSPLSKKRLMESEQTPTQYN
jgi:hypothetical protein